VRSRQLDNPFDMEFERTEFSDESYGIVGRALAYAVKFEADCRALNLLFNVKSRLQSRALSLEDEQSFHTFVNEVHKRQLNSHVRQVIEYLELPTDIGGVLQVGREKRNEVAHDLCVGIQNDVETDEGRERLLSDVSAAIRAITKAHEIILLVTCAVTNAPPPSNDYLRTYADRVAEWVCSTSHADLK